MCQPTPLISALRQISESSRTARSTKQIQDHLGLNGKAVSKQQQQQQTIKTNSDTIFKVLALGYDWRSLSELVNMYLMLVYSVTTFLFLVILPMEVGISGAN